MESESSDATRLPWIWFLECLAGNKQVNYLTLRDVARKVPELSGSAAMHVRELLALRCLEGLAEMGDNGAPSSKIGLDLSQRCSVILFLLTSEAVKSGSGLDGVDVSKWDLLSIVEHKRAQLPKCTLERLEEMVVEGKDPAALSLGEISGIKSVGRGEDMDMIESDAKVVSLGCDETSHQHVAAGMQRVMDLIPENEEGSCIDGSKDVLLQEALMGDGHNLEKNGDMDSDFEKSIEDMQVRDYKQRMVSDVTLRLKEDVSGSGKKPQHYDTEMAQFSEQSARDDQRVHTLQDNQKLFSGIYKSLAPQTVLGKEFREEVKSPAELDTLVTANCNQQQAVLPVDCQINITNSDGNQNFDDGLVSESVVGTSRDYLENKKEPSNEDVDAFDVETYNNEEVDAASLKNNFISSQYTTFDWTEPTLCMKCNKSGPLLCCGSSVCSVAVHGDCLGVEPYYDDSGSFRCPFCASSLATAEYQEAKSRVGIRKRELDAYLSSSLSDKLPQRILNKKKRRCSKQDDISCHMEGHNDEESADTRLKQPDQNVEHVRETDGDSDVNSTHESTGAGMGSDLPVREINTKATGHGDLGVIDEGPVLQVTDILPPGGQNINANSTSRQPQDAFTQLPLTSEESEHRNRYAIVLYEGDKGYGKKDVQNPPESKIKYSKPAHNIPNRIISKPTSNVPYQSYPANRRRKVPWSADEEDKLREGVKRYYDPEAGGVIPWLQILEFGALVFQPCRTAENLKDKWRNICKRDKQCL